MRAFDDAVPNGVHRGPAEHVPPRLPSSRARRRSLSPRAPARIVRRLRVLHRRRASHRSERVPVLPFAMTTAGSRYRRAAAIVLALLGSACAGKLDALVAPTGDYADYRLTRVAPTVP